MLKRRIEIQWLIISLAGSALINLMMVPMFATADTLPPRGTPTPTAIPAPTETPMPSAQTVSSGKEGARLQLHVKFGDNWDWDSSTWQDLWTEVEWTDGENWNVVEGWRGNLDGIVQKEVGDWVSWKEWWVAPKDLDSGPFRWVIYQREGGDKLATSDPFHLPAYSGQATVVDQAIGK